MPKELWFENKIPGDYRALSEAYGVSPAMARLLVNRLAIKQVDLTDNRLAVRKSEKIPPSRGEIDEYLFRDKGEADFFERIYSYGKLPDIDKCVDILASKIARGEHIRVIGDYDIDGVCSTFILTHGLHKLKAYADYAIPHRINDGYGLNDRLIKEASDAGVDCIITCDNGISASAQIDLAHELGMTVIVTDHHEVPYHMLGEDRVEDIPDADAVVDIKRNDSEYGFTEICGAVVALKVMVALYDRLGVDRSEAEEFIEIAAFATIGDVMPLIGENRTLVNLGLQRLKDTENHGLRALIRGQGIAGEPLRPYHVGFILGPCINATGRLATAENAYELLDSRDTETAERLADMLIAMNNDRKDMTETGLREALRTAGEGPCSSDKVLVIYLPDTHESVAGIIAGKVREQTGKPCFVLTDGEHGIKGSGRSIDEYDMHEAMTEVSELFEKFGGHKMAGGLSLADGVTPDMLRGRLNDICTLTDKDLAIKVRFDMELPFSYVNMGLAEEIGRLEPYGVGNAKPLFAARGVRLTNVKIYGRNNNVLKCRAVDGTGMATDAVYFGDAYALSGYADTHGSLKLLYSMEINEYRGTRAVQIRIEHYC